MNARGPKLLLISDGPGQPTGLGGQSTLVYEAAVEAGFQVVCAALVVQPRGFPPRLVHMNGMVPAYLVDVPLPADHLGYVLAEFQPDQIVSLCDGWMLGSLLAYPKSVREKLHFWTTADHEFFPNVFQGLMNECASVVFMADFGAKHWGPGLARGGKRTLTIPHAVDGEVFRVRDPAEFEAAKRHFGTEGHFIALHVGRNQHRKQQPLLIEGWARFVKGLSPEDRAKTTLYLHTEPTSAPSIPANGDPYIQTMSVLFGGLDLQRYIDRNYPPEVASTIRFSAKEQNGVPLPKDGLATMYAVADVHVQTSAGEGFGCTLPEAQACGRANLAADNTTTPQLVGGEDAAMYGMRAFEPGAGAGVDAPFGWRVPCNSFTVQPDFVGKRPQVDVDRLAEALHDAWELWRAGSLNGARAMARRRDWTLARFAWPLIRARWVELLRDVREKGR